MVRQHTTGPVTLDEACHAAASLRLERDCLRKINADLLAALEALTEYANRAYAHLSSPLLGGRDQLEAAEAAIRRARGETL